MVGCIVVMLQTGCTSSRVTPNPASIPQPAETPRHAETISGASSSVPLVCPTLGSSGEAPATPAEGKHRVILSWKASAPVDSKHAAAMGYCIYRGVKHKDPSPELVNSMPFPGTRCMDDVVQNDKKYYYVVRAISAKGVTSIVSNEAPASIPAHSQTNPTVSGASAPLCREPANGK